MQELMMSIGKAVALMHDGGLVHGDLTTSNLLIRATDRRLVRAPACTASVLSCQWQMCSEHS